MKAMPPERKYHQGNGEATIEKNIQVETSKPKLRRSALAAAQESGGAARI
jgi:hypothetical protein